MEKGRKDKSMKAGANKAPASPLSNDFAPGMSFKNAKNISNVKKNRGN